MTNEAKAAGLLAARLPDDARCLNCDYLTRMEHQGQAVRACGFDGRTVIPAPEATYCGEWRRTSQWLAKERL